MLFRSHRRSFEEAGFRHGSAREPRPDDKWLLLVALAKKGEIDPGERGGRRSPSASLRVKIGELRDRLKRLCDRDEDPFQNFKKIKVYKLTFPIEYGETAVIPLPSGRTWEHLTLCEVQEAMLEVDIETTELTGAYGEFEDDNDAAGQWLAAQTSRTETKTYSFQALELLTDSGRLNRVGESLRQVLRNGGKQLEQLSQEKGAALNRYLSELFQIPEEALEYDPQTQHWQCRFKAESKVALSKK